ncbi:MAG: molybdopterin-dependent oxidoreductase [Candidatus Cloacimonetes bacterium]|nr:molybdopterin-dependent oxidoreductase [Candidatus Cloacimonadota bacterium]
MYNIIGKEVKRVDGYEKVTGKAIYGDDIKLHGMLFGVARFTDIPCGKIKSINTSKAEKMPGVVKIAMYKDIPGQKRVGPIRADYFPIVNDEVFFGGDVIAVVAAKTKEQASAAADAINITYEPKKGIFDIEEAVKPGSHLVHSEFKSNVVVHYPLRKGDIEKGFNESDHILERKFKTGFHEHAYIEPETVTVVKDPTTSGFKVYGSIQNPFTTRKVVAIFMGLKLNQVNVFGSTLGGSFGGKDDIINNIACRAALLCELTGKPIKITYTREESLKESYKRHPYIMNYKVGFSKIGKLKAMKINILADSGAYSSQTFFVTWRSVVQATGPYEIPNVETDIRGVYTNNTYTAAFRGFGSPQVIFAQESLMDEIAEMCNISAYEIRKINGYKQDSITASGQCLSGHKVSLMEVVDLAVKRSDYHQKIKDFAVQNQKSDRFKQGIGLACSFRGCSLGAEGTDASSAIVSVQADGSIYVFTGVNENGQGLRTTFCQIVSEIMGVDMKNIIFLEPQTATITDGGPTVASRGTLVGGNATIQAAKIVQKRIFETIKKDLDVTELDETLWENDLIKRKVEKENIKPIPFIEAAEKAYWDGENLSAYGWFKAPEVGWDEETGQGNAYFTYVYGCQIAETLVDTHTGKIEVKNITAVHDVGKVLNKLGVEGQVYGGVTQGVGYSLFEDYDIQNGVVKSENLDTYLIPTIHDIENIDAILVENNDQYGPFGAKGIGEPTLELASASLNNSLAFALKKRFYQIPLTLEQVKIDKNLRKPERQSEVKDNSEKKQSLRLNKISSINPKNLKNALELLSEGNVTILAGGTDVIVQSRSISNEQKLLNIYNLPELVGIVENDDNIAIKGGTSFSKIISNSKIKIHFPLLVEACAQIGSKQIRNRATIAGNIVNAAPCADSVPPLILYKAMLKLQSKNGERDILMEDFINWSYNTKIEKDEILTLIIIPKLDKNVKYFTSYYQLGRRKAVNITRMSISSQISFNEDGEVLDCRLVDGSLFSRSQRLTKIENLLVGKKLTETSIQNIKKPLHDQIYQEIGKRWSSEYKLPVFIDLCVDALMDIKEQCEIV